MKVPKDSSADLAPFAFRHPQEIHVLCVTFPRSQCSRDLSAPLQMFTNAKNMLHTIEDCPLQL